MPNPALVLIAGLALTGCSTKHAGTYEVATANTAAGSSEALMAEAEALWAQRTDLAMLQAALGKYEQVAAADPTNREAVARLVRGYYFLGDRQTDKDQKLATWDTAITWGKRCLAINTEFTELLEKGDETEATAARAFTEEDVPCLYWTSSALGKWAKLSGLGKTLKNLPTVKAWMTRVQELDPDYFYSGPDRYWGAYYAAIPSFAGRDLDKSRRHLDAAIAAHPEYLGTKVILAEYWARGSQDRETFVTALQEVLDADPDVLDDIAAENRAEQDKARALLANVDEYFAE